MRRASRTFPRSHDRVAAINPVLNTAAERISFGTSLSLQVMIPEEMKTILPRRVLGKQSNAVNT